jgi:hypothetical protein
VAEETAVVPTVNTDVAQKRSQPRLEAISFADYANMTGDGKAIICGIVDRFFVDPEKKKTGNFYLYVRTVETIEGTIEMSFFDPNGQLVAKGIAEIDTAALTQALRRRLSIIERMSLDTPMEGEYWIDVSYGGQSLGGASFAVEFTKKEPSNDIISEQS